MLGSRKRRDPFSQREKVAAKQPDEGMLRRCAVRTSVNAASPHPSRFGGTLSLWERVALARSAQPPEASRLAAVMMSSSLS